jgi:uncharacterized oxidoreductase
VPTFAAATLRDFARRLFEAGGVPPDEADLVAGSLVLANLSGHDSHGVMRVPQYVEFVRNGKLKAPAPFTVLTEAPAALSADGGWGLGQVQAHRLLGRVLDKAKDNGTAAGTLRHAGHTGRLGEYAEVAAERGFALIATVNSHGSGTRVAPPGGTRGRLSTNPLCLGAPTPDGPLVLDIGTSVVAEGKVRVAHQKGERIPEGWILDAAGRPTTDPADLYTDPPGTLLPLGGAQAYKGFGLSMLLDLFVGGLSGGSCSRPDAPPPVGNSLLFVALDVNRFGGGPTFLQSAQNLIAFVRSSPPAAGAPPVMVPGDPERAARTKREREGVPVPEGTWKLLTDTAARLGVVPPPTNTP